MNEGSAFTLAASFFDDASDAWAASAPTTAKYRIDRVSANGTPGRWIEVLGWTALTPATANSIPITAAQNAVQCNYAYLEPRQVTVKANDALSTQVEETYRYSIINLAGTS